ncbi:MAG: cyclopropane-fatty-acyl-phospholipid synthase [Alphaproteobacteria bacterium]|nr:cyclopropane-fatty-acyl-phospholipid synthase [Alphaproteobacteria bacterium]
MDGTVTVENGDIYDFLDLLGHSIEAFEQHPLNAWASRAAFLLRSLRQHNPVGRAQQNVAHHYDLSGALYDLFLDEDRQYSCAYFRSPEDTLEQAQLQKKQHIAAKLLIKPEHKVLDIGCGWGGMALYLARATGADVTGVTLSVEQQKVAQERAEQEGLAGRVRFALRDYRHEAGKYDRIVSVGMFEHVGARHYDEFFAKVRELLADDGVMLLHAIARMEPPGGTNAWLRKYIFPGGYSPALSEVLTAIERSGLWVTDCEILRLHYAFTLREWRKRFLANRERIKALYDERFCRMWEFYLAACEMSFRHMRQAVFQMQITKHEQAVPLTRDYMYEIEREYLATRAAE